MRTYTNEKWKLKTEKRLKSINDKSIIWLEIFLPVHFFIFTDFSLSSVYLGKNG